MTDNKVIEKQEEILIGDKVKMLNLDQVGEVMDFYWNKDGDVVLEIAFEDGFTYVSPNMIERVEFPWKMLN
jgi:hypothetical protein